MSDIRVVEPTDQDPVAKKAKELALRVLRTIKAEFPEPTRELGSVLLSLAVYVLKENGISLEDLLKLSVKAFEPSAQLHLTKVEKAPSATFVPASGQIH